jgi:hypothetical protein
VIDLADIQRVHDLAKRYLADRKKYERLIDRSHAADTPKQSQKAGTDLSWAAMDLIKQEAALHAACVDAGLADLRNSDAYAMRELRPSGWHVYAFDPPKPRDFDKSPRA